MDHFNNVTEVPGDYETREFVYRGNAPVRSRKLRLLLGLLSVPVVGSKISKILARQFQGSGQVTLMPDFRCLFGNIVLGTGVALHDTFCVDYAPIVLHDGARLSFRNMLITSTHDLNDFSTIKAKPIVLEDNVWVTSGCIILGGVRIGRNSIIAAGSVVTKSIPENVMAGGNPARVIKEITR